MTARSGASPAFTVVVCTRDRPEQLDQCLASLSRLDYPAYEVLVVDNAPPDERSREVAFRWGVRYLIEPVQGLSRARNAGAHACQTELVVYLDDDAVSQSDWLSELSPNFEDPLVAAVTGAILPTHVINAAAQNLDGSADGSARGQRLVVDRETSGWFEIANFGRIGDGSNMAFRRSAFDMWPGFDEHLGRGTMLNGGEEHYAFFTLIERGYRIVYNPDAIVRHPCPCTVEEARKRHLSLLAASTAYITRLAVEHPSSRRALARYFVDRLRGTTQPWAKRTKKKGARIVPRRSAWLAMLSGSWIYFRSRIVSPPVVHGESRAGSFAVSSEPRATLRDKTLHTGS